MADFTQAYVNRVLAPRLRGCGRVMVKRTSRNAFTIVYRYRSGWNGRLVALPIARLRLVEGSLQLFWQRANGRWVPYEDDSRRPFIGSLNACVSEIQRDRWGCFWG